MNTRLNPFAIWATIFNQTAGRFFTVEFIKKDGSIRRLNGKIDSLIDPNSNGTHIIVKDIRRGYRKVNPRTIRAFKCSTFQVGRFLNDTERRSYSRD